MGMSDLQLKWHKAMKQFDGQRLAGRPEIGEQKNQQRRERMRRANTGII